MKKHLFVMACAWLGFASISAMGAQSTFVIAWNPDDLQRDKLVGLTICFGAGLFLGSNSCPRLLAFFLAAVGGLTSAYEWFGFPGTKVMVAVDTPTWGGFSSERSWVEQTDVTVSGILGSLVFAGLGVLLCLVVASIRKSVGKQQ